MPFFFKARVNVKGLLQEQFMSLMSKEVEAVHAAKAAGIIALAQRTTETSSPQVVGIANVESREELDRLLASLPLGPYFEMEEAFPTLDI